MKRALILLALLAGCDSKPVFVEERAMAVATELCSSMGGLASVGQTNYCSVPDGRAPCKQWSTQVTANCRNGARINKDYVR